MDNIEVYNPGDFTYFGQLGSGAFGKVRKCQLKSPSTTDDVQMDNTSTSSNSSKNPSASKDDLPGEIFAVKL